jgi:hypothetical protein
MSGERAYFIVHGILVLTGIVSIVMARKRIPDKQMRKKMNVAFSLLIFTGILMPVCQKIYRWAPSAYAGDATGVTEGLFGKIMIFRHLASLGYLIEVAVVAILVVLAKRIVSNQTADPAKIAEEAAGEVQQ